MLETGATREMRAVGAGAGRWPGEGPRPVCLLLLNLSPHSDCICIQEGDAMSWIIFSAL